MTVTKVVLAKLSPTMEEGTIVRWAKNEGDAVKPGDVLAEIETDKANMEMEAMGAGVLRKILVAAGGKAPVGGLIGVIAEPGDDIAPLLASAAPAAAVAVPPASPPPVAAAPAPTPVAAAATPAPAAAAPVAVASDGARVKASPLARSIAARQNIALSGVQGSGPGGRIIRRDVDGLAAGAVTPVPAVAAPGAVAPGTAPIPGAPVAKPAAAPPPAPLVEHEVPVSSMRRVIAKRLSESKFTAPHFYVTVEIDMAPAVRLREELAAAEARVSFNDLVVKACAKALLRFPMVNASWLGDRMALHGEVHVGVAVAMPDGLIVPVVRNADRKSVSEISHEVKDLAARARDRKLKPEEFSGSTFSISNLGMYDVSEFTAIINPPESAILAVGAVRKQPVVEGDQIVVGHRMKVTLSCDHRVVDGALGAAFLAEVRRLLEHPLLLLI